MHDEHIKTYQREKTRLRAKAWYAANREKELAKKREAWGNNKDGVRDRRKQYELENRGRINTRMQTYREKNLDQFKAYEKRAYDKHRLKKLEGKKKFFQLNKDRLREPRRVNAMKRRWADPVHRVTLRLRRRVHDFLTRKNRSMPSMQLLGTTPEGLRAYLASLFVPGMSWENYGPKGWHVDHKLPCASFELSDPEQQKRCFHYTNLQPLWWADNLAKGDKILARSSAVVERHVDYVEVAGSTPASATKQESEGVRSGVQLAR